MAGLFRVDGGPDGPGSFTGFYQENDGTLRHLEGWEWQAYVAGGNAPQTRTVPQMTMMIREAPKVSGPGPQGRLDGAADEAWNTKAPKADAPAPAAPAAPAKAATSPEMTNLLARFGVDYQAAPAPTPAMLAFMRGLGMTLDTAADTKQRSVSRIKERSSTALSDIDRGDQRTQRSMLADMVGRGVLRSGEANTRFGEQAENVARSKGDVLSNQAEGIDNADIGYNQTRDSLRQGALERTINAETDQATRAAQTAAQTESYARQDAGAATQYTRQREAEDRAALQQEDFFKRRGQQELDIIAARTRQQDELLRRQGL